MPDFLYRFRTVDRLLGNQKSKGELTDQYIYFASPEQLNDPLEGHREIFFSGDEIVWQNLFKHYFSCLLIRSIQFSTLNNLQNHPFPTHHQIKKTNEDPALKNVGKAENFLNHKNIKEHIKILANGERKVTRSEVAVHLRSIHLFAASTVVKSLSSIGIQSPNRTLLDMQEDHSLKSSTALLALASESNDKPNLNSLPDAFEIMVDIAENEQLIKSYRSFKASESSAWQDASLNFVGDFLNSLKKLTHSEWYTACFMESCSNYAIWGSYGDNHAGACLIFKTNEFNNLKTLKLHMPISYGTDGESWGDHDLQFHKVKYEGESPPLDLFRSFGVYTVSELRNNWYSDSSGNISKCADVLINGDSWRKQYWERRQESLTIKMPDWKSENEYRLILENNFFNFEDSKRRCLKYDFNSLEGIIFGIKTSIADKCKLALTIEKLCHLHDRQSFTFHQAYHDTQAKCIKYRPTLTIKSGKA